MTTGIAIVLGVVLVITMVLKYRLKIKYNNLEIELGRLNAQLSGYSMTVDNLRGELAAAKVVPVKKTRKPRTKKVVKK